MYVIERGKNSGSYTEYFSTENKAQALAIYLGVHVHSGGKKRLIFIAPNGVRRTIKRHLTNKYGWETAF
jgi:hypothetical protein